MVLWSLRKDEEENGEMEHESQVIWLRVLHFV